MKKKNINKRRQGVLDRLLRQPPKTDAAQQAVVEQQIHTLKTKLARNI